MNIAPRLGPSLLTAEEFASQAFRSTHAKVDRLPAQLRGAVVGRVFGPKTADDMLDLIESGERSPDLEPHDAFLAFSGQPF